jgi:HD superfamily phosphohydrolase YqeK
VVVAPTVRESDGLALSSRNVYLSADERARARRIPQALAAAEHAFAAGERSAAALVAAARAVLAREPDLVPDYTALADPETLEPVDVARLARSPCSPPGAGAPDCSTTSSSASPPTGRDSRERDRRAGGGGGPELPPWAAVSEKRLRHITRVTALLDAWAPHVARDAAEARALHDAGRLHDALRDAPEPLLRELSGDPSSPTELLHGPAAATMLAREGGVRADVLDAVRWHTLGAADWGRVGRALYMADFLEPGRKFAATDRAFLAAHVRHDFDGVFRQVVRMRLQWSLGEGLELYAPTVALWNAVR